MSLEIEDVIIAIGTLSFIWLIISLVGFVWYSESGNILGYEIAKQEKPLGLELADDERCLENSTHYKVELDWNLTHREFITNTCQVGGSCVLQWIDHREPICKIIETQYCIEKHKVERFE